jgi:acyl-CoA dehydrogenase
LSGGLTMVAAVTRSAAAFLDPTQVELAAGILAWSETHLRHRAEPVDDADARRDARELLTELGASGWLAHAVHGDLRSLAIIRDAVGAMSPLADAVIALQALGGTPIVMAGSADQRDRWLPSIIDGRVMTAFAMTEPEAGSDVAALQTEARRDGDGWILNGEKHLISNAGIADLYVMFARTTRDAGSRGISAFLVPASTPGLTFAGAQVMAAAHPLGRIQLVNCRVPAEALLGEIDRGFKLGMMTLDRVRATVGAAACGMAARALDEALIHAANRRQFGHPLGDLQLVREKLGRMATELQAARLLVFHAAWLKDRGADRITVEAAMAKSYATEAAQHVVDDAVQIVGGRGVLLGHPVERLYRSVRALRIYEGATDVQRLIVGGALLQAGKDA